MSHQVLPSENIMTCNINRLTGSALSQSFFFISRTKILMNNNNRSSTRKYYQHFLRSIGLATKLWLFANSATCFFIRQEHSSIPETLSITLSSLNIFLPVFINIIHIITIIPFFLLLFIHCLRDAVSCESSASKRNYYSSTRRTIALFFIIFHFS